MTFSLGGSDDGPVVASEGDAGGDSKVLEDDGEVTEVTVMDFNRYNLPASEALRDLGAYQPSWAKGAFCLSIGSLNLEQWDPTLVSSLKRSSVVVRAQDEHRVLDAFRLLKWEVRPTLRKAAKGLTRYRRLSTREGSSSERCGPAPEALDVQFLGKTNPYGGEGPQPRGGSVEKASGSRQRVSIFGSESTP